MVTIKDLQDYTKISMSTISRALRTPENVSTKKLTIIRDAVEKLGYIPNYYASNLKSSSGNNIGLIVNDVQNPFFNNLIKSIEANLANEQFKLLISFGLNENNSIDDKVKNFLASSVAGIMFSPNKSDTNIEKLIQQQYVYPLQLFAKVYDNMDSIVVDDFYGTYLATKRLLHAGHRNILIMGFSDLICHQRIDGYKKAFEDFNLKIDDSNIFFIDNQELIAEKIGTKIVSRHPTAIISIADTIGIQTVKVLKKLSINIYDDISLILYDDSQWADLMNITAIGHPIDILGQTIAKTIVNGIRNKENHPVLSIKIEPLIIERNSIKSIN
jgi:LacI family transcriptional regulator